MKSNYLTIAGVLWKYILQEEPRDRTDPHSIKWILFKFKFFIFPKNTSEATHFKNTLNTYRYQWEGKQKKQCLSRCLPRENLKNTHKRTHDIWNIKNWKTFLHKHYCEHIVYMRTWIHTPCIITIFFRCQPFKWRDISRDLVIFFLIMSLTVVDFLVRRSSL